MRIDIISDTHGHLSDSLLEALKGADVIVHAGDMTSEQDLEHLRIIAPVHAVLGNNDGYYHYGSDVARMIQFEEAGLKFAVAHYREDLPTGVVDVAVCGHTHRPKIQQVGKCVVVNPGSASFPRQMGGPTMARMFAHDGHIDSLDIIKLESLWPA